MKEKPKLLLVYPDVSYQPGILKKIRKKVEALNADTGVELSVIIFGKKAKPELLKSFGVERISYCEISGWQEPRLLKFKIFWPLLLQYKRYCELRRLEKAVLKADGDAILLRDFRASWYGVTFLKKLQRKFKVLLEINTNLGLELKMIAEREHAPKWAQLEYESEKRYKPAQLKYIDGAIGVTQELISQHAAFMPADVKTTCIANGFDLKSTPLAELPKMNDTWRGVFLAGAGDSFYKFERVIKSLEAYRGAHKFHVDVYGESADKIEGENFNIQYHSKLEGSDLDLAMNDVHFGISTMGLYQKGLNEASTLKVREYLARGLPVLLGYNDTDIGNDLRFVMTVPNGPENFDFNAVDAWLSKLYPGEALREECRSYCQENMSFDSKCEALISFTKKVCS